MFILPLWSSTLGKPLILVEFSLSLKSIRGKIFATTLHTLNKEVSLLSLLVNGSHSNIQYDREGRLFIDRDPTHFRWMLNYLRYLNSFIPPD